MAGLPPADGGLWRHGGPARRPAAGRAHRDWGDRQQAALHSLRTETEISVPADLCHCAAGLGKGRGGLDQKAGRPRARHLPDRLPTGDGGLPARTCAVGMPGQGEGQDGRTAETGSEAVHHSGQQLGNGRCRKPDRCRGGGADLRGGGRHGQLVYRCRLRTLERHAAQLFRPRKAGLQPAYQSRVPRVPDVAAQRAAQRDTRPGAAAHSLGGERTVFPTGVLQHAAHLRVGGSVRHRRRRLRPAFCRLGPAVGAGAPGGARRGGQHLFRAGRGAAPALQRAAGTALQPGGYGPRRHDEKLRGAYCHQPLSPDEPRGAVAGPGSAALRGGGGGRSVRFGGRRPDATLAGLSGPEALRRRAP